MGKKVYFIAGTFIIILLCGISCKFIQHEYKQNEKINQLNAEVKLLSSELENITVDVIFPEDTYNYLAIGNSITLHDICNFWWNECGMAASKKTEDYFHKLCMKLEDKYGAITAYAYNFSVWEIMDTDRAETLSVLDSFLSEDLDLITIQLGENVSNLNDFEEDYKYLLEYITDKASDQCEIIVIGDFWERNGRDDIKKKVCSEGGYKYVDLSEIKDSTEYECGIGAVVYDEDGNEHIVTHSGVAEHPNDKGMSYIAEAVFDKMEEE